MFLLSFDGLVAESQILLIESPIEHNGTPYCPVHYRHPSGEIRITRAHPDYVAQLPQTVAP